ncbi:MAG: copper chaperone PCu(A)C [Alphaproteobacteria bacterium]|nr:copper chaperone PCu(A)C [Alphaproteobacteria bacterium]
MRLVYVMACLFAALPAFAGVELRGAWLKPSTHGLSGVISMDLLNTTDEDIELVGAEISASRRIFLQQTELGAFGRRSLRPVSHIKIPAQSFVTLEENGLHIMLQGVKDALMVGVEVPVTLLFKNAPAQIVRIPVLGRAPDERDM